MNLQAPLVVRGRSFDTTDWAPDIWVAPGGAWRWKDEDDFARAQELGVWTWPTGWEEWRAPREWKPLTLPEGWDVV